MVPTVEAYIPNEQRWVFLGAMPTARRFLTLVTWRDGSIFVLGGAGLEPDAHLFNLVEAYRPDPPRSPFFTWSAPT